MDKIVFSMIILTCLTSLNYKASGKPNKLLDECFSGKVYLEHREQYIVNCTNTNFNNTDMLKILPEDTQVLIFTGNNIPTLPWNIFGEFANLSMLHTIDMSNNKIRNIKGKTYHHVLNVERLILNHNDLTVSSEVDGNFHHPRVFSNFINLQELHLTNAFADNTDVDLASDLHDIFVNSNLTKLYKLHLEQNEIKDFKDKNVFCDLPNLHQLYLGDNYLTGLSFNVECLKSLEYLDLERNNVSKFTQSDLVNFDKLTSLKKEFVLDIDNNPFKCDSSANRLYNWMSKTNVTIRNKEQLKCATLKNGNKYLLNLKILTENRHAKFSKGISVLLVILVFVLITLLGAYLYLSRDKIKNKWNPFVNTVSRKVQYTTIESQDV